MRRLQWFYEKEYLILEFLNEDLNVVEECKFVNCDLCKEVVYNMYLIYKNSGVFDFVRQVLKDYCILFF